MKFLIVNGVLEQFSEGFNKVSNTVVDMSTVTCMDDKGLLAIDYCTNLEKPFNAFTDIVMNTPHYLQENDAVIVHIVHKALQLVFNFIDIFM